MRRNAILFGTVLLLALGIGFAQEKDTKDKAQAPEAAPPPTSADDAAKKNPVKPHPKASLKPSVSTAITVRCATGRTATARVTWPFRWI